MIIDAIKQFFAGCPFLSGGHIYVDYLPPDAAQYSIEPLPTEEIVKKYTDGGSVRKYNFVFAARLRYTEEIRQNIENNQLFENVKNWIEEKTAAGELPSLEKGQSPIGLEVISSGYCFSDDGNENAVYQMQCRLVYYKD